MKKYFEQIKGGVLFGLSASITIIIFSAIAYAAGTWSATSPTSITRDASLYSDAGNTITATKWNELVSTNDWKTISSSDTASFDITCERRMITSGPTILTFYADYVSATQLVTYSNVSTANPRRVSNTDKSKFTNPPAGGWILSKLEYKCPTN